MHAASREEEFWMKIEGKSYEEIAAAGGGIHNSARKLQEMSEEALFQERVGDWMPCATQERRLSR